MARSKQAPNSRWYTIQRNYKYECEHKDGKYYGLSEDEWRKKILEEWSPKRLNAKHVTVIFHDKCTVTDEHGNVTKRELHAHAVVYFKDSITETEAMKRTGCTRLKNVKIVDRKARAYRYLLHISEGAISDGKHIYSEDELIIMKLDESVKYDYHKLIKDSEEDEDVKEEKNLLKKTIRNILVGGYDEIVKTETIYQVERKREKEYCGLQYETVRTGKSLKEVEPLADGEFIKTHEHEYERTDTMTQLLRDSKIANLIGSSTKCRREIENAIKTRKEIVKSKD